MKVLLAGVGSFGSSWLKSILLQDKNIEICGLVDKNPEHLSRVKELKGINENLFYSDVRDALIHLKPDFLLNATPPGIHKTVNLIAFEFGIPVLCEKPIAEDYKDAIEIYIKSKELSIPVMIAENYRYDKVIRTAKKLIASGEIGKINTIHVDFHRRHIRNEHRYVLSHPLLLDVSIHHLDVVRYLTGAEALTAYARSWNPEWSWYKSNSCVDILLEMENNIRVSYCGSLAAFDDETGWQGAWRIEGDKGVLQIAEDKITLRNVNDVSTLEMHEKMDSRRAVLEEFICSIKENRKGETDIEDNLKTYAIVQSAIDSINKNKPVDCSLLLRAY